MIETERHLLTQLRQRVLHFKVVPVKAQKPLGDVERVVACAAGDGVGPGVQADLKEDENQVTFEEM